MKSAIDQLPIFRLRFKDSDFRKLSEDEQLFFIRLGQIADDLRHVFYLSVPAERASQSASTDERKLGLHQLLFCVRLIYSILNEAWRVIKSDWHGTQLGKKWHPKLTEKGRRGVKFLGKYFGQKSLSENVRDEFGFHYGREPLREPMGHVPDSAAEIMTGKHSANIFYTVAEQVRALALWQAAQPAAAKKIWDKTISKGEILAAAIKLYEAYRPIRDAFDDFANDFLVTVVKSLSPRTEKFSPPRVTKFSDMQPVLFVEEPH